MTHERKSVYTSYNTDGTIKGVVQTTAGVKASNPVSMIVPVNGNIADGKTFTVTSDVKGVTFSLPNFSSSFTIFNLNGQIVANLPVTTNATKSSVFWDTKRSNGIRIQSGNYIAIAPTGNGYEARSFVLMR